MFIESLPTIIALIKSIVVIAIKSIATTTVAIKNTVVIGAKFVFATAIFIRLIFHSWFYMILL